MPRTPKFRSIVALLQAVRVNIKKHGWHLTSVGGDAHTPPLLYTSGLSETYGHPELLLYGVDMANGDGIVRDAVALIVKGQVFQDFDHSLKVVEGFPVIFRHVPPAVASDICKVTRSIYTTMPSVLQIVWPDPAGVFPWEPGFQRGYLRMQPVPAMQPRHDGPSLH